MIVLVFSVTNRRSFEYVKNLSTWLEKRKSSGAVFTIIANKVDLSHKRQVTQNEATNFAQSISASYYEVSAAIDIEPIREVFKRIFLSLENATKTSTPVKSKKTKIQNEPKRKHSSIIDIFKKRPSV